MTTFAGTSDGRGAAAQLDSPVALVAVQAARPASVRPTPHALGGTGKNAFAIAIDGNGDAWIGNQGSGDLLELPR